MTIQTGDYYRCPEPTCGCEIDVTKGPGPTGGGNLPLRCCCGRVMELLNKVEAA